MSEKEKRILKTFEEVFPKLTEIEKEKLLSFGEGMAFVKSKEKERVCKQEEKRVPEEISRMGKLKSYQKKINAAYKSENVEVYKS